MGLALLEVIDPDTAAFQQAYDLYNRTFPKSEKEDRDAFRSWLEPNRRRTRADRFHLLTLADIATESVVGIASFYYLVPSNCGFLGYLAIHPRMRNQGLGSRLYSEVVRTIKVDARREKKSSPLGVFTELDRGPGAEMRRRSRRRSPLRFWEKHDMRPLDLVWRYPSLREGVPAAEMYLSYCPISGAEELEVRVVRAVVRNIFKTIYGKYPYADDLGSVLESIPGTGTVRRLM